MFMPIDFQEFEIKGNELVAFVADDLSITRDKAGMIISTVFHSLRNRLTHEQSFQLLSHLPMSLKGAYVDGWKFNKDYSRISHTSDFLDEVSRDDDGIAAYNLGDFFTSKKAVSAVFNALKYFISEGEMQVIIDILPPEVKTSVKESLFGTEMIL
jgi:uncharacterized protein (DUF2267 family)